MVELLDGSPVQMSGHLRSLHWSTSVKARPMLELGVFLLRLICTNGAYSRRVMAEGKLMAWASRREIDRFLDEHFDRVLGFAGGQLQSAVQRMSDTIPEERQQVQIRSMIERLVSLEIAEELLRDAVSNWDHANALTAAANRTGSLERRRKLQIAGGEMIDQFLVN
jgi:hypothetical protein